MAFCTLTNHRFAAPIFTNDDELAKVMREIRVHGQEKRYHHTRVGIGGRMDTIQCAVVLGKMERFGWELEQRALAAQRYRKGLANAAPGIEMFEPRGDRTSAYAQYTIKVQDRDKLEAALKAAGIPTAIHYPVPLHRQPAYDQRAKGASYPVSEQLARQVISLPMHADLGAEVQERIVRAALSPA